MLEIRTVAAIGAFAIVSAPAPLAAQEYLARIDSEVFQTTGSQAEIAARARTCIAQTLAPGVQGGQLVLSDDGATIVANNVMTYSAALIQWTVRSRIVFEAREGRFRIAHTNIERFVQGYGGWQGILKQRGSGWKAAETAFQTTSTALASCVQNAPADDW